MAVILGVELDIASFCSYIVVEVGAVARNRLAYYLTWVYYFDLQ